MSDKLTLKQEKFCLVFVETGNASEAYRQAYETENMKPETINRNAKALMDDNKIATRIGALQEAHRERHDVTVDSLTEMIIEDRTFARANKQPSAAVSATMGLAKLHGLASDKLKMAAEDGQRGNVVEDAGV